MSNLRGYVDFIAVKPFAMLYGLGLTIAVLLFERHNPFIGMVSGLLNITSTDPAVLVVSVTQFLSDTSVLVSVLVGIAISAVVFSVLGSLLFSGFLGSVAEGVDRNVGFPGSAPLGFIAGYRKFMSLSALIAVTVLCLGALLLVWAFSAVPLAVVGRAVELGAINVAALFAASGITLLVVYIGSVFLRVYSLSCLPVIYSGVHNPVRSGFRLAGRNFWEFLSTLFVTDMLVISLLAADVLAGGNIAVFAVRCAFTAAAAAYVPFVVFRRFGSGDSDGGYYDDDGYGYNDFADSDGGDYENEYGQDYEGDDEEGYGEGYGDEYY